MKLDDFMELHGLPPAFAESAKQHYLPFADWLYDRIRATDGKTFVLGINGAQGTGKSTCADLIHQYLASEYDVNSVVMSIDDIYRTRRERHELALNIHPLLETRGVPGTHDVALGLQAIDELRTLDAGSTMQVPRFDKSKDDRLPEIEWPLVTGPVDLVIFEGWCVASRPCDPAELQRPVNSLEREEDSDGVWRAYVNDRLAGEYNELFGLLDALLFLKAPNFDIVYRWRLEQEHKLRKKAGADASAVMSDEDVARFIQYYERITRHNIEHLPDVADTTIVLNTNHQAESTRFRN